MMISNIQLIECLMDTGEVPATLPPSLREILDAGLNDETDALQFQKMFYAHRKIDAYNHNWTQVEAAFSKIRMSAYIDMGVAKETGIAFFFEFVKRFSNTERYGRIASILIFDEGEVDGYITRDTVFRFYKVREGEEAYNSDRMERFIQPMLIYYPDKD